ncbi:Cullin-3 [Ceratocystis platani]|uniref:Cullin-3 n=1 Tax=Ceratocystis fimbriata f. sp. platani TaxID=88771 RepID=A0A0F8B205_CERFI|nr:Cullin-3 [Ceratocystis platani]
MMSGRLAGGRSGGQTRIRPPGSIRVSLSGPRRLATETTPDHLWSVLRSAILCIHRHQSSQLVFEQLYRAAYNLAIKGQGEFLYEHIRSLEADWLQQEIFPPLSKQLKLVESSYLLGDMHSENERYQVGKAFMALLKDLWSSYGTAMNMIADICMYLDRSYIEQNNKPPIYDATMALFRDHILLSTGEGNSSALEVLVRIIIDQVSMERSGQAADRLLLKSCSCMLNSHVQDEHKKDSKDLYTANLVPELVRNAQEFYQEQCQLLVDEGTTSSWITQCNKHINDEIERYNTYLYESTLPAVIDVLHESLIRKPLAHFVDLESSGLHAMIDNGRFDEIRQLYELESRIDPKACQFNRALQEKIVDMGKAIEKTLNETDFSAPPPPKPGADDGVAASETKQQSLTAAARQTAAAMMWVSQVLELESQFSEIVMRCCDGKAHIDNAVNKGFMNLVNRFQRSAEFVSLYIDESFRKGIRGKEEPEIEALLEQMIKVIRYIDQKDLFERYYQKHLARRLLYKKSESSDIEQLMISRMKREFGNNYTSKFESMFHDLDLSQGLTAKYRESIALSETPSDFEMSVTILTHGAWPADILGQTKRVGKEEKLITCNWPASIKPAIEKVNQFYLSQHSGRTLSWVGALGEADVICTFPAIPGKSGQLGRERRYELHVPVYGMIVLDLFNDIPHGQARTFDEIFEQTSIPHSDLVRTLLSLSAAPKCRMLLKDPATKNVKSSDKFSFNTAFVSKNMRIKAPVVTATAKVETDVERKATELKNDLSRAYFIDATIVRIMKQRKELAHAPLVSEIIKQMTSRFTPDIAQVKKRIEDLLARDYLERIEDVEPATYRYLA